MCGICGIIGSGPDGEKIVSRMSELLVHRGPDQEGVYTDKEQEVFLAHRRLSIIDLSELGRQPMMDDSGNYVIVFNGEIYNFQAVRRSLRKEGFTFRSRSDTEVILKAYIRWGSSFVKRINGMFALGIYDKPKGTVYFYRDRIGEKPLYYIRHNRFFAFASEVKAFRGLNRTDFHYELDREMVDLFMGFTWLPESSRTMLEGVERLAPGEMLALCVSDLSVCKSVYWSLQVDSEAQSMEFHDAAEKYEEMLEKSVRDRLQADVPVGILLSGGLDSSLIAALAQKASDKPIKTFTVSLDHEKSESRFARIVSSHIGSEHHELFVEHGGMIDKLKEAIPIFDDLTSTDGGLLGTRLLCREIRKNGIKVVLLGEGADEVNAGYNKFAFSKIPFSFMPDFVGNFGYYYAIGQNLFLNHKTLAYARKTHRWIQEQVGDKLQKLTAFDIKRQLPNHLLMKVDKGSMAESVEARTPYLDYHLVEYGFSLPAEYKIKRKRANPKQPHEKYILRRIAEKYLPPEIAWRKKFGMLLSIESTVKENRNSFKELMLSDSSHPLFEYFSEDYIRSLFDVSKNMFLNREREWFIFKLVVFYLWVDYIQKAQ